MREPGDNQNDQSSETTGASSGDGAGGAGVAAADDGEKAREKAEKKARKAEKKARKAEKKAAERAAKAALGDEAKAEKAREKAEKKARKAEKKAAERAAKAALGDEAKAEKARKKAEKKARKAEKKQGEGCECKCEEAKPKKLSNKEYEKELARLQVELVKLQAWVKEQGLRVVVVFEGRDAAGKGGVIKRITQHLNPRICRVVALPSPTEREKTQWYFQRYVAHLPAAGEIVLLDRSWYNRAGVERVMGFCSDAEYQEFLRSCPEFERMLVRSHILVVKYWFSVSDEVQEKRFQDRIKARTKRWKLSPMDLESRSRWVEYSRAKDVMFAHTDIKQAPWYVVQADDKKKARLNCIAHLLSLIPYQDLTPEPLELPPRQKDRGYVRPPMTDQTFVPEVY
jgi:polyphosphate kinase 2